MRRQARQVLEFLFPVVAERVDWTRDVQALEEESRSLVPEAEIGNRLADKVLKVRLKTGDERVLHLEVQAQPQNKDIFAWRVFVYFYRDHDKSGLPPEALVILADDDPKWKPTSYKVVLDYTKMTFEFKPVKLLDWRGKEEELRNHENPMGLFVLAHLEAQRTQGNHEERAKAKLGLLLALIQRKLDEDEMRQWYRYLDWFLNLPKEMDREIQEQVRRQTQEMGMSFVTFADREALEQGEIKGLLAGIEAILDLRFKADGLALMDDLRKLDEPAHLSAILQSVKTATSLDDVRKLFTQSNGGTPGASS